MRAGPRSTSIRHLAAARRGLSLLEVVVSTVIVSVSLVASITLIGSTSRAHSVALDTSRAALLADTLLTEVMLAHYEDPQTPGTFGPEAGETARELYDDVDDYDGYSSPTPTLWTGEPIEWVEGWSWSVSVAEVGAQDTDSLSLDSLVGGVLSIADSLLGVLDPLPLPPLFGQSAPAVESGGSTVKRIVVTVTDPRGAEYTLLGVRTLGGIGDATHPAGGPITDTIAVRIKPEDGPPLVLSGPLLGMPEDGP